jgi:hypothetical protein
MYAKWVFLKENFRKPCSLGVFCVQWPQQPCLFLLLFRVQLPTVNLCLLLEK